MTGAVHATKVDRSKETGTLVVCTCGLALGPYVEHEKALRAATDHRQATRPQPTEEQRAADRAKSNAYNAEKREARRRARETDAAAERPAERLRA